MTVVVGGEGADELFAGYPRYIWLRRAAQAARAAPSPVLAAAERVLSLAPVRGRSQRLVDVVTPKSTLERHLDWVTDGRRDSRISLYGAGLKSFADRDHTLRGLADAMANGNQESVIRTYMSLDQRHWLPDDVLVKADRAGMRTSLEIRTPYLHRDLAEFAQTVGAEAHARGGGKFLLKEVLKRELGVTQLKRPKRAFLAPAGEWLRGPLAGQLEHQLRRGPAFSEGWFDRKQVQAANREHLERRADMTSVLWPVLTFALWLDELRGPE